MLVMSGLIGVATFSKGKVLTSNHALALRTMTLDNAFVDMQRLVDHTVQDDADLVYGIYIGSERVALAYSRHGKPSQVGDPAKLQQAWVAVGLSPAELFVSLPTVRRVTRLEQELMEVAGISTRTHTTETSGRGIGMAAVKHCAEQLKGRMEVRSSEQGTTWLFQFPTRSRTGTSQYPETSLSSRSQVTRLATG